MIDDIKPNSDKTAKKQHEKGWREIIFVNWMTVILSGIILSSLNHFYWQKQEEFKKREIFLQEKVKVYSSISKELTNLIMHINHITYLKNKSPSDKKINELQSEVNNILAECGKYFSYIKIYFSQEANIKVDIFYNTLYEYSLKTNEEIITKDSGLYKAAKDLANQLSTELRKDFTVK